MLNNSPRHPRISGKCRDTHTFPGLARDEASGTGACVCARQCWTKERDIYWQVHLAVKAPLFNFQTTPPRTQNGIASLLLVYLRPRHSKFVPNSLEKCWVYNLDLSAALMHAMSVTSSCSTLVFYSLYSIPSSLFYVHFFPCLSHLLPLCICVLFI